MPPDACSYPLLAPVVKISPLSFPVSPVSSKYSRLIKRMKFPGRKLIPLLLFILSSLSVLRLLRIAITTSPSPSLYTLPPLLQASTQLEENAPKTHKRSAHNSTNVYALTKKEFQLLSRIINHKAPCNVLVFGLHPQYLTLPSLNHNGTTIFLEDDSNMIRAIKETFNMTRIYKVEYQMPAKKAYYLLKQVRDNPACVPNSKLLQQSACQLALINLPQEVYETKWDVVFVDGPSGDSPEAAGRMATIYTAGMIARAGNVTTDVLVHDVHRTIEKWFSWEFLCEENLVSSKGKLWNFRLAGQPNSTKFCSP